MSQTRINPPQQSVGDDLILMKMTEGAGYQIPKSNAQLRRDMRAFSMKEAAFLNKVGNAGEAKAWADAAARLGAEFSFEKKAGVR